MPTPADTTDAFTGIPREGLAFLEALKANNDREWFHENHDWYRVALREPMLALAAALGPRVDRFAPGYDTPPRRAVTMIHRDLRFQSDRSRPYKTWLGLAFRREEATLGAAASFYVSVSPRRVHVRCGLTMPTVAAVGDLRAHLIEEYPRLRKIMRRKGLQNAFGEVGGERLRRIPPDVPEDHPAVDLLLYRSLYVETDLPAKAAHSERLVTDVAHHFRMAVPLVHLIDEALLG